jgi:galactokinase/mevalonate kinase-like predicted kinase
MKHFWRKSLASSEIPSGMGIGSSVSFTILISAVHGFKSKYGGFSFSNSITVQPKLQISQENVGVDPS